MFFVVEVFEVAIVLSAVDDLDNVVEVGRSTVAEVDVEERVYCVVIVPDCWGDNVTWMSSVTATCALVSAAVGVL